MDKRPVTETNFEKLYSLSKGKVRDNYGIPGIDRYILMVATDRISAFDVVMSEGIPGKGKILTAMTLFWLNYLSEIVPNHLISSNFDEFPSICQNYKDQIEGRSMMVKKVKVLPIECIVRGCISGSMWKAYQKAELDKNTGCKTVLGHIFPKGLTESDFLQRPIFTPSTKAEQGLHDENINFQKMIEILKKWIEKNLTTYNGTAEQLSNAVQKISLQLYRRATDYARTRGIIIADTKFEFGISDEGELTLIDEVLTPDSSRFWPAEDYEPGRSQPSFDKQYLRDYLQGLADTGEWNKQAPPPTLPDKILKKTQERYEEALKRLTK